MFSYYLKNINSAFRLWLSAVLLTLPSLLFAQSDGGRCRVFGTVKDDAGTPIELASVRVKGQAALTVTNLKGEYSLYCSKADTVTVVYSMIGYETRKRFVRSPGDSVRIDVVLPPFGMQEFGEAVVKAQALRLGSTERIAVPDTKLMPSTTGNAIEEIIATQAGVSTHN